MGDAKMQNETVYGKIITLDFDGCLCSDEYPKIGSPKYSVIASAQAEQQFGARLILLTKRDGTLLENAIKACKEWGLVFDAVNDNLPEIRDKYGDIRKVVADEHWSAQGVRIG